MTSTLSSMDLREQLTTLLLGNALCGHMVFRKDIFLQVVPDLGDPCIGTTLRY
jgi:hypothetical protein